MKSVLSLFLAVVICIVNTNSVWASSVYLETYTPIVTINWNDHTYNLYNESMTWKEAKNYCESIGGHLVTINSEQENNMICSMLSDNSMNCYWIGLSRNSVGDDWEWINGEPVTYTNWADNEPNNDRNKNEIYVHLFGQKRTGGIGVKAVGQWNDVTDNAASYASSFYDINNFGFICEWDNNISNTKTEISRDSNEYKGHKYAVFDKGLDWNAAKEYCESLGGHLATISSKEENEFIYELMTDSGYTSAYFGLTDEDEEGIWEWVNGEPVEYTNWHKGEPNSENSNEDYAMFYWKNTDGTWNDGDFGGRTNGGGTAFICEWDDDNSYNNKTEKDATVNENNGEFHFYLNTATNCIAKGTTVKMYAGFFVNDELSSLSNEDSYSISISDNSIITAISTDWDDVYGQCYIINALKPGTTTLTMTNLSNGAKGTLDIHVVDSEMVYNFKTVPEMTIEEGKITNFYNYCGMVVDNFNYKEHKDTEGNIDYYDVTMTVYNSLDLYGAVTAYDAEGNVYDYDVIEKFTTMESSFTDSVDSLIKEVGDLFYLLGNEKYYSGESISTQTDIHVEVPVDGYIEISNSPQSVVALISNTTGITVDFIFKTGNAIVNTGKVIDSGAITEKVLYEAFTKNYLNDVIVDTIKDTAKKELMNGNWTLNNFGDGLQSFFDVLAQSGFNLMKIITEEIISYTGVLSIAESAIKDCIPTGDIIDVLYNLSDVGELIIEVNLFNKSIDIPAGIYIHPKGFTDVTADSYFYDAVKWAVDNGITSGISDDIFNPNAPCTRAQALTFLWRAVGSPNPSNTNTYFTDLDKNAYYYNAVLWAVEQGIASGISAEKFGPDEICSRAQIITFLYRQAGSPTVNGNSFNDVGTSSYYTSAVKWAVARDITSGTSSTAFSPESQCTRGQIVTFLYRYMV